MLTLVLVILSLYLVVLAVLLAMGRAAAAGDDQLRAQRGRGTAS